MGSINFGNMRGIPSTDFLFKDIALDLRPEERLLPGATDGSTISNDILASFDRDAVRNSIGNILGTMPGENLTDPEFGCALKYFLFSPMTDDNANNIGEAISQAITKYEPRVNIEFIDVIMDKNKYTYEITLTIGIPSLGISSERFNVRASEAGGVEI